MAGVAQTWLSSLAFLAIGLCFLSFSARAQEIWLAPHAPGPFPGVADWDQVFQPNAPWQTAASHVKMLILADGSYDRYSDAEISRIADFMAEHGAKLGVGINAVTKVPNAGCGGMEGYGSPQMLEALAARLSRLHVQVGYVEADGALWFGHFDTDPQACRLPVDEVARRTAPSIKAFLKYYPNAIYGDVEGSVITGKPDWRRAFDEYRKLLEQDTGHKIDALNVDVSWPLPSWPYQLAQLYQYARANGLRLGVIYNGDGFDPTDAAWMDHAERNFERIEGEMGIRPDEVHLSSWDNHPERFLPETSPTAFSHLVLSYLRPRTRFEVDSTSGAIAGRLLDREGHGVANASVLLQSLGLKAGEPPPEASISGTVPAQATSAVFALGINFRPDLAGNNDVLLGDFVYFESSGGAVHEVISVPGKIARDRDLRPGGIEKAELLRIGGQRLVRLTVRADQSYHFNSPRFAVDGGARFTLAGPIASITALAMFGAIDIVWFDARGNDKWRSTLHVEPIVREVARATTDSGGQFRLAVPTGIPGGGFQLFYQGNDNLRGTYANPLP